MSPVLDTASWSGSSTLVARQYGYPYGSGYGYTCNNYNSDGTCYSRWYSWGRWVLLGCIIAAAILIFVVVGCISSRRRRRQGQQPFYGTGWMGAGQHGQATYYGNQQPQYEQNTAYTAPPQYAQQTGNSTTGYYGGQTGGNDIQPPSNVYRKEESNTYAPPSGPPPGKY